MRAEDGLLPARDGGSQGKSRSPYRESVWVKTPARFSSASFSERAFCCVGYNS
jgi:hypothetical protein